MSQLEYELMVTTAQVQESTSGTTHVAFPADPNAFQSQAAFGSLYVEFDVADSSVKPTQQRLAKILGPSSLEGRSALRTGAPIPQMPSVSNIRHIMTK